jgi:nucleoside-diphosphate-sugar epimerase
VVTARILVTGGGGVVGGAIVAALNARGDTVRSFARGDYPQLRVAGVETIRGDIADLPAVERAVAGCDAVIHVAARSGFGVDARPFVSANVVGTANVIAACRRHGVRALVHTSTPSVVHTGTSIEGGDETLPYATRYDAPYPATKARAEQLVLAANDTALATTALRPHLVWGPRDTRLTAHLLARARARRLWLVDHGRAVIDATYIDDAASAHVLAVDALLAHGVQHPVAGRPVFIASGQPLPIATLVNGVLAAAGLPAVRRSIPLAAAVRAGAACETLWRVTRRTSEPPMTRFMARQLATSHWFDLTAARRDLGYTPSVTIDEALRRLAAALRESTAPVPRRTA